MNDEHDIRKDKLVDDSIDAADYNSLRQKVATLEQKLRESEAACAAMRNTLLSFSFDARGRLEAWPCVDSVAASLANTAGKSILNELEAAKAKQSEIRSEKDAMITALWKRFYKVYKSECGALSFDDFVDRESKYIQIDSRKS